MKQRRVFVTFCVCAILILEQVYFERVISINIREIAALAGVSVATVSRALNTPELVQARTRERVLKAVQEAGYTPGRARGAKSTAPRALLFLYDAEDDGFYNPILPGMETVLQPRGYMALFCPLSRQAERRSAQMAVVIGQKPAGVIWALRDFHAEEVARLTDHGIPLVLARKYDHAPTTYPHCYIDFTVGAFRMTQHLLSLGHRHIALLVEKASFQFVASFCGGWKRAYFENNLPFDESWIVHTPNTVEGGHEKACEMLLAADMPDAFFCASNEMAFGVLRAARELNIAVPDQLAIVGFTDSPVATLSEPPLTTIRQPLQQLGAVAARMLLDRIESPPDATCQPQEIVLQPQLCIRKSCGSHAKESPAGAQAPSGDGRSR